MKKVLYIAPAFLVCLFVGIIGLLFGFEGFQPVAWGYVICALAGSILLCKKHWWGGLIGALSGVIVIWEYQNTGGAMMVLNTLPIGIGLLIYYLSMALVCFWGQRK